MCSTASYLSVWTTKKGAEAPHYFYNHTTGHEAIRPLTPIRDPLRVSFRLWRHQVKRREVE